MRRVFLVFPHQLFKDTSAIPSDSEIILLEEYLFFRQYPFHKQKILLHRASMRFYFDYLKKLFSKVGYVHSYEEVSDVRQLIPRLKEKGCTYILAYEPSDNWLQKRLESHTKKTDIILEYFKNPMFINNLSDMEEYMSNKKKYFQTDFYIHQRKKRNILLDTANQPAGGKWSYDTDNRKKYPKDKTPPKVDNVTWTEYHQEAAEYVGQYFPNNYGSINQTNAYPIDFNSSEEVLNDFLQNRFKEFGVYEDAIVEKENYLNHAILTPMLNIGLLTPHQILDKSIQFALENDIPLNSLEGFVRQILGWREFIRMIYLREGGKQRTQNYWNFSRKIPKSFYTGQTGIVPIDSTIKKLLNTAYNHHIERLMVLSNFMLLCEFDPDEVYRWFMEMYIDSYDWVMVPNVYGMGQFADGGLMCTKPYISGSNYIFKMSDYKKRGEWPEIWDALFWRFMDVHRDFFLKNPRLGMLIRTFDKWNDEKKMEIHRVAEGFLEKLERKS
jgi:deoxyribodipyrimidine photolyase-related protein